MDQDAQTGTPEPNTSVGEPEVPPIAAADSEGPGAESKRTEKSRIVTLKDGLDLFGKLMFGFAGLCYVLGVVVVTIHLRQYGVNSLDLPQLHYVTAGVWVVLPIAFITIFSIFGIFLAAGQTENMQRGSSWTDRIGLAVGTILALIFIITFFWGNTGLEFSWKSVVLIPRLGILATLLIFAGAISLKSLTRATPVREFLPFLGVMILGVFLFAAYVLLFAQYTYQSIPWATGGGRASVVRLFMTPYSMPYVQGLNVTASQKNGIVETNSIKLLLTTEKQFVVINADGKAVSLPTDMVKGITYEK